MRFLLDTNICIYLLKNKYGIRERIIDVGCDNCCISEISIAELYYGASKSGRKEEQVKDIDFLTNLFNVLPIDMSLETYGDIKADLETQGMRIDDFDLLIGASAVFSDMVIVTENIKHFDRIPNIRIEKWVERNLPTENR